MHNIFSLNRRLIFRFLILIFSLFISAIVFNLFLFPTNLVTGGLNGIAIILNHIFNISPSLIILVGSLILLLVSFLFLDLEKTIGSLVASVFYPFFVSLPSPFVRHFIIDSSDLILISVVVGIFLGICNGLMYKVGFNNGGLNIISQVVYKYFHISLSKSTMLINFIIVLLGGVYFGFNMMLYAFIIIYISGLVIDKVILGISKNKAFYITVNEYEKVRNYLIQNLNHSVTIFDVVGGFLNQKRKIILAVVPTRDYFKLKDEINKIDPSAFFLVTDAYEVRGGN